jgi:hypothetical protein
MKKGLFKLSSEEILKLIKLIINKKSENIEINNKNDFEAIVRWIKKRSIINQVFNGKCVGCGEITTENNLAALNFHHSTKKKSNKWKIMRQRKFDEIIKWLKEDKCVCLCGNCHSMIHNIVFVKYSKIIFKKGNIKSKIDNKVEEIRNNIKNFKIDDREYRNPLES